jgi:hypothetical protein
MSAVSISEKTSVSELVLAAAARRVIVQRVNCLA